VFTIDDLVKLGFGSRNTLYYLARQNRLPVPVISVGKRLYVSKFAVQKLLGEDSSKPVEMPLQGEGNTGEVSNAHD
jgi:hypothetical protein